MRTWVAVLTTVIMTSSARSAVIDHHVPLNYNFHGMAHSAAITGGVDEWTVAATNANADLANGYRSIADRGIIFDPANPHSLGAYSGQNIGNTGMSYAFFDTLGYGNTVPGGAFDPLTAGLDIVHIGARCTGFAPATIFAYEAAVNAATNVGIAPAWNVCNQAGTVGVSEQITNLGTGILIDPGTEIGVIFHGSSSGGRVDVVLGFTDATTLPPITIRCLDWFGNAANAAIEPNAPVSVQAKLPHVEGAMTFVTFQGAANNDAPTIGTWSTTNGGPNLNIVEAIISVPRIITGVGTYPASPGVVGKTLNSIKFQALSGTLTYPTSGGRGYAIFGVTTRNGLQENANCATPTVVTTSGNIANIATNNLHAFGAAPSGFGTNDTTATWFSYTATDNVPVLASTCTTSIDTTIAVYPSCGGTALVGNNDAGGCGTGGSRVTWLASNGQTYLIRVAGNNGAVGNFTLHLEDFPAPPNGSCLSATSVGAGANPSNNLHAFDGTTSSCGGGGDTSGVWFAYTATATQVVEARTCNDGVDGMNPQVRGITGVSTVSAASATAVLPLDTTMQVFTGSCGSLTSVACNDNGCNLSSRVQWNATNGTTYLIRVAGNNAATGNFTLFIDDPAHVDLTMPLQFNWNGICHGTTTSGPLVSEQTVPTANPGIGSIHENRSDLNGYRSIADRGLLFDPNNTATNALNYGGTVGFQGMVYSLYDTALQSDIVHLGNRALAAGGLRNWSTPGTLWPADGGTSTSLNGLRPIWLNDDDQTSNPQVSSMTGLNAVFGQNTQIGILFHISNVDLVSGTTPREATFDVTLTFTDSSSVMVRVQGSDWFGGTSANPYNQVLPLPAGDSGLEVQRVLGIYRGVQNTDKGDEATTGPLKVHEAVITTSRLQSMAAPFDPVGKTLDSISFGNLRSGNIAQDNIYSAVGIYAATLRDPASFDLNFGPTGIGTVTPNQLIAGSTGKMVVTVSRGSGTPNNITSVVVDGTNVGLPNNLQLNDSGTNGDVTPNDNKWSRNVSFPVNTAPGAFSLPFLVTDAQNRTDDGNIIFTIITPPGGVTPGSVVVGSEPQFTVTLSSGGTPAPGIASVTMDASQFGLSNTLALNDAGANGDTTANDGIYSRTARVALGTGAGAYVLPFTVTDTLANTFNGNMPELTVNQPTAAVTPPQAFEGITCKYTVNLVLNGLKSTNITSVTADLSPINLSNAVALNDSGNNGDVTANDGIWSVDFVVPVGAPTGQTQLQFAVVDSLAEGASGFANFSVSVLNDLGVLGTGLTTLNAFQNPGDVHWYRFSLAADQGVDEFLDIDTEETFWTGTNDTHIALYTSSGSVFLNGATPAVDDDDGTDFLSQLTFGNSTVPRSAPGNGLAYNGRDGILTAGTYYLAVTGFTGTFNAGFSVTTTSTQSGSTVVRLSRGTVPAGGPPASFIDLGVLGQTPVTNTQTLSSGGVVWFKFVLDTPVDGATPTPREYFDIDSEGSSIFDTMIALYRDDGSGTLVTSDDNDGSGNYSQLTYGRGTRDPVFDSQPYNGRDGLTLAAGTYYLAVTEFAATFGNNFVVFFNTGTSTGDVTVNLRRGVQSLIVCGPINNPANNHDYYLLEAGLTGTDAEAYAVNTLGGHLVTVNDTDENEWVRSNVLLCNGAADRRAFIGLNDLAVEGVHEWFNGEPVSYTNWSGGEPNNGNGTGEEDYSEMLGNGLWNDIPVAATATRFALVEVGVSPIGDMDCSGVVDPADVQAFVLALIDPSGYAIQYPGCSILNGDMNTDTLVNGLDIDPFSQLVIP